MGLDENVILCGCLSIDRACIGQKFHCANKWIYMLKEILIRH